MHQFTLSHLLAVLLSLRFEVAFVLGALLLELWIRGEPSRFRRPSFLTDLLYCAFYRLGVFTLLFDTPIRHILRDQLHLQLLPAAPLWVRVGAYLLILDLTNYWIHRWQHSSAFLWAFHRVHHSQTQLTALATYRTHPVDAWLRSVIGPAIFMLLLGIPPAVWFPLAIGWDIVLNLSHMEVDWGFRPLHWLVVSPRFHSLHHSIVEKDQQYNFSMTLSIWDYLFGTARMPDGRPAQVGLSDWESGESIGAQLFSPVRFLAAARRARTESTEPAPEAVVPPVRQVR
ncbi:MAG: sterol desaturase family protein [Gemmatimonadota bacterium]